MNTAKTYNFAELETIKLITEYKRTHEELSALKKTDDALKKKLLALLGDGYLEAGDYKVTLKVTTSRGLDTKTLRAELPELWDEYGMDNERKSIVIV